WNPGYIKMDLATSYKLFKDYRMIDELQLFGKFDNILDKEYFEVMGFPAPGFTFLAGLKVVL
ncbi:MAG: TonB-dependent receptor, partial [Deltaproteobacteria bacterium]